MQKDARFMPDNPISAGEALRLAMRRWPTGVAIVTSTFEGISHGMTVNSFNSVSIEPPLITVTMAHNTRTHSLTSQSGVLAISMLSRGQQHLAELFAGRVPDGGDRMSGLAVFPLVTGAPLLRGGMAFLDCRVVDRYEMPLSTLFIAEVLAAEVAEDEAQPLLYFNRRFGGLENEA